MAAYQDSSNPHWLEAEIERRAEQYKRDFKEMIFAPRSGASESVSED